MFSNQASFETSFPTRDLHKDDNTRDMLKDHSFTPKC